MGYKLEIKERKKGLQSELTTLRKSTKVPGIIYGKNKENIAIIMDYNPLLKILITAAYSNIITLKLGKKEYQVIVREYQQDPVTDKIIHVDFMIIDDKVKLITTVPLSFTGLSPAVKEKGAKLDIRNESVKVKCLPQDLPSKIVVDVSVLKEIGKGLVIKDLAISEQVEILNNPQDPVINTSIPKKLEIITPEVEGEVPEGEEGEEGAEIKEGAEVVEGEEGAKTKEGTQEKTE